MEQEQKMKDITAMKAGNTAIQFFRMPKVMFAGKETRYGGSFGSKAPEFWNACLKNRTIQTIRKLPSIIPNSISGWTGDYSEEDKTYTYMIGTFVPPDTLIPENYSFRILPATIVALGLYDRGFPIDATYNAMGYRTNYELCGWNAEMYFESDPDHTKWRTLTPVVKQTAC